MEAQLKLWKRAIDDLTARAHATEVPPSFDFLISIDELRALHVIAQSKFDAFMAADHAQREPLADELTCAWDELAAALKNPNHRPKW